MRLPSPLPYDASITKAARQHVGRSHADEVEERGGTILEDTYT